MDIDCRKKTGCLKKYCAFCCTFKRDLLRNNNFEKTIEILPRVIVCKKLKACETYCQTLTVRNLGTLTRRIKLIAEPNSDTSFKVNGNTELTSGSSVSVDIYVEPTKKNSVNRNRFFYVVAEHPDIVWEIPILVIGKCPEVFVPQLICLYKVPANTISNYQFIIYNPLETEINFSICSNYGGLTVTPLTNTVSGKDYCKILINGKIPGYVMTTTLNVCLNNGKAFTICVHMEPSDQLIHLSTNLVHFEDAYMGSRVQKNFYICNKSMESAGFRWTCSEEEDNINTDDKADDELVISDILRIRNKRGCIPPMNSALSIVTFSPPIDFDYNEEEEPPFKINIPIYLRCPIIGTQSYQLHITASILGPEIEISPKDIDVGDIYMGQMQCLKFDVTNTGPINGKVFFKDHTDQHEMRCLITPELIELKPTCRKTFQMKYYRRDIGKFLTKLTFKIKSGNFLQILLRGNSLAARVKIWPESFEYDGIPICIPQKRFAMVTNPLPVPIVVEPMVIDDGTEDPLILCVDYSKLPLNTRPAAYYNLNTNKSFFRLNTADELKPTYSNFDLDSKPSTTTQGSRTLSVNFQDKVIDNIPMMAESLLQNVKNLQAQHQPEPGMKIIDAALDCIFDQSDYFEDLKYKQNYLHMNWKALPTDAKEVGIEVERFYLKPNESKSFPIVLIPNSPGPCTKTIEFKACPVGAEHFDLKAAVRSKYMVNALRLQYKCTVPVLEFNDTVKFFKPLYIDMVHKFYMKFKNNDSVPGFVYYNVIPASPYGQMKVKRYSHKFFLAPDDKAVIECTVIFRKVGTVILHGMIRVIGRLIGLPFSVEADVLPPKIQITPDKVSNNQQVLETSMTRMFIENICPAVAKFTVSLKNDKYQFLEPLGGIIGPGQKILISIYSRYFDPGMYKNVVYVHVSHAEKMSIPITVLVEGTPLKLEPNIKLGLDCGNIFRNNGYRNNFVTITNFGEKTYRLLFVKKKIKPGSLGPPTVFNIDPNGLTLTPKSMHVINIKLDTSKEISVEEEYSVDGMGEDNYRFKFFTFIAKCTIIKSKVIWNINEVCLEAGNADPSKDKMEETVSLINTTALVANVNLNVVGYFILRDLATGATKTSMDLCLTGKQMKQFTVYLNEDDIDPRDLCQCYKGSIKLKVNDKVQKPLLLHAKIVSPNLKICTPEVTFFSHDYESYAHVYIQNCGPLKALFDWREATSMITKTVFSKNYELLSSNTISEMILSLPDQVVMKIPEIIKPQPPEICAFDDISSIDEEEEEEEAMGESISQNPSLKRKASSGYNDNFSKMHSTSLKSSLIKKKSLESQITENKAFKPFAIKPEVIAKIDINQIFNYLGLPRPMCEVLTKKANAEHELGFVDANSDGNEEKFKADEEKKSIRFQLHSGAILPKTIFKAYMFLPPVNDGDTLKSKFLLDVMGGRTETLDVTITTLKGRVQFSTTDIDLGREIWHKTVTDKIQLTNHCPYAVKITIIARPDTSNVEYYLIDGHVSIGSPKMFVIMPGASTNIEWKVLFGLRYNFFEHIGIEINNNTTAVPIHFHGAGYMPVIVPKFLNRMAQKSLETVASYLRMRTVFQNVQAKTNPSGTNVSIKDELATLSLTVSSSTPISGEEEKISAETSTTTKKRVSKRKIEEDFVALNYSEDTGPRALEIERLVETWKLIAELNESEEFRKKFHKYYCDCLCLKAMEFESVINLKLTICRPIPWELPVFILNMGDIQANETKNVQLELMFFGPGKLFLSARTRIVIPGLIAWFEDFQTVGSPNSFVFFMQSPEESTLKKYKNMHERSPIYPISCEEKAKLPHAHSYDVDDTGTHRRKKPPKDMKKVKDRYTKISQPFKEKKNPLVLAEICQNTEENWDNSTFKLLLMFTAMKEFYDNKQRIEDYLYIDIHLGPTLPILLRGYVHMSNSSNA